MIGESREVHALDRRMIYKVSRNFLRVGLLTVIAKLQRLDPAQQEETIERPERRSLAVLDEVNLLGEIRPAYRYRASRDVAVPAQILRRRVHHDVRPEIEWVLQVRRHHAVIHAQQRAIPMRQIRKRPEIDDSQQRIRRRLYVNQFCLRRDLRGKTVDIAGVSITNAD